MSIIHMICYSFHDIFVIWNWRFHDLGISWTRGNAESLPFGDNSFDLYTVAFGIRNMTHVEKVLLDLHLNGNNKI